MIKKAIFYYFKKLSIKLFVLILVFRLHAQTQKIENIKATIFSISENQFFNYYADLCDEYESIPIDSLKKYVDLESRYLIPNDSFNQRVHIYHKACYLFQRALLDSTVIYTDSLLNFYSNTNTFDRLYPLIVRLHSNTMTKLRRLEPISQRCMALLSRAEQNQDTFGILLAQLTLANLENSLNKSDVALRKYKDCLALAQDDKWKILFSQLYNNLAIVYYKMDIYDTMFYMLDRAIEYGTLKQNLTQLANTYMIYGGGLSDINKLMEAEQKYKKGIEIRQKIGEPYFTMTDMSQLSLFYLNSNQAQKGIELCKQAEAYAIANGIKRYPDVLENMYKCYKADGQFDKAMEFLEKTFLMRDTLYAENSEKALAEMQTKYEVEKKEKTIMVQKLAIGKKNTLLGGSIAGLLLTLTLTAYVLNNRKKNHLLRMKALELTQKGELTHAILQSENHERKRIGADLHDNVAQKLVAVKMNLQAIQKNPGDQGSSTYKAFQNAKGLVDELATDIRNISHTLMQSNADGQNLINEIQELCLKLSNDELTVSHQSSGTEPVMNQSTINILFRIIQESIQNAMKHSQADQISIYTLFEKDLLQIMIRDNGKGFVKDIMNTKSFGLTNMKSRAEYLKGAFAIDSIPEQGTTVKITIPLSSEL